MEEKLQAQQDLVRLPFYTQSDESSNAGYGQYFLNCYPTIEHGLGGDVGQMAIEMRSGVKRWTSAPHFDSNLGGVNGNLPKDIIAITQLDGINIIAVFDATASTIVILQYKVSTNAFVKIGSIAGADKRDYVHLSELNISGTATLGVVWTKYDFTSSKCYYATSVASVFVVATLTQIVDAEFPDQAGKVCTGPFVQMNGTTYIMTTSGAIHNSDLSSISSWNSLGVIQAIQYPDNGVGLVRYKHHIIAFGRSSVEFFNDVGNPTPVSPLQRTQQAFIKFGCISPYLFVNIDDELYWVSASQDNASGSVWRLDGYTPTKISTSKKDQVIAVALDTLAVTTSMAYARMVPLTFNGKKHLMLTNITEKAGFLGPDGLNVADSTVNVTGHICYCMDSRAWWIFTTTANTLASDGLLASAVVRSAGGGQSYTQMILKTQPTSSFTTNVSYCYLYILSNSNSSPVDQGYSGNTPNIAMGIQTKEIDFSNGQLKFIRRLAVVGNPLGATSITTGYSRNGYGSNIIVRVMPVGSSNVLDNPATTRAYLSNLGACRKVVFYFYMPAPSAAVWREMELTVAQGTH